MPRKAIGATAMTDAERQARYRAARAAGVPIVRTRRALDHRGRAKCWNDTSPASCRHRLSTPPGSIASPTASRTVRPPKPCARSARWTSPNSRQSSHHADSAETDSSPRCRQTACPSGSTGNPPRAAASASRPALRAARVPPMDYRHKPPRSPPGGSILDADRGSIFNAD